MRRVIVDPKFNRTAAQRVQKDVTASSASRVDLFEHDRALRARVDIVVSTLPLTIVLNPIWAALTIIPLGGDFPAFGVVELTVLLGVVGMHALNSALARVIYLWARQESRSPSKVLAVLTMLQVWISVTWGAGVLACWVEGNAVNNTFLALLVIAMIWALALTRSVLRGLFAAGIVPLAAMFWLRAALGSGEAAEVFLIFTPVFTAYAWFMGSSSRDRINELIRTRFALEDMARDLDAARHHAEEKSAEAEAASASKSAFVANMSHELRTPLNSILGFAEIIEGQTVGPQVSEQYRSYATDIRESGAHLLNLINDMLDIAKIEAGRMEIDRQLVDAKAEVETAVRLIQSRSEAKGQTISVAVDERLPLFADERALKQILLNLLSNAVKFSPEGGTILVRGVCEISGAVRLSVEDSGPGIPDAKLKQLFKPFSQVDNRYDRNTGGTGLGLSLVRGLISLHAGRVWLENKPEGTGLKAILEFPPSRADIAA
ncbi:MAG: HAMP domain-containing histidine kinase [Alphaproteobacteria bacterium]|nr:HAMP domain-containing histidine kinase [Alphaproteobacteria bacterium]